MASATVSVPSTAPTASGAKTTLKAQFACAPKEPAQVSELRKPLLATAEIKSSGKSPAFESVMTSGLDCWPTEVDEKTIEDLESVSVAATAPVPLSKIV